MIQQIPQAVSSALFVIPVTVYPQGNIDSMGDSVSGTPTVYNGYVYEHLTKVINFLGEEELSGMQIYLKGEDAEEIASSSKVSCLNAVQQRLVARQIFRTKQGVAFIGVLYLP